MPGLASRANCVLMLGSGRESIKSGAVAKFRCSEKDQLSRFAAGLELAKTSKIQVGNRTPRPAGADAEKGENVGLINPYQKRLMKSPLISRSAGVKAIERFLLSTLQAFKSSE